MIMIQKLENVGSDNVCVGLPVIKLLIDFFKQNKYKIHNLDVYIVIMIHCGHHVCWNGFKRRYCEIQKQNQKTTQNIASHYNSTQFMITMYFSIVAPEIVFYQNIYPLLGTLSAV